MTVEIGCGRKITATKDVLNELSMYAELASENYARREYPNLAEKARDVSRAIYYCLLETGYYD